MAHTRMYEEDHDDWKEFRDLYLVKERGKCQWSEVYKLFKWWWAQDSTRGVLRHSKGDICKYFEKHLGFFDKYKNVCFNKETYKGWNTWGLVVPQGSLD